MTYGYNLSKTGNKGIVFIYKNNFKPIFLSNIDIKLSDLDHYPKIQILIFISKKCKANIKILIVSSNSIEDE